MGAVLSTKHSVVDFKEVRTVRQAAPDCIKNTFLQEIDAAYVVIHLSLANTEARIRHLTSKLRLCSE